MKKLLLIILSVAATLRASEKEYQWITRLKFKGRYAATLGISVIEPPAALVAVAGGLKLLSHSAVGQLANGWRDPVVSNFAFSAAFLLAIRSMRATMYHNSPDNFKSELADAVDTGRLIGSTAVTFSVHGFAGDGILDLTGARVLYQPLFRFS